MNITFLLASVPLTKTISTTETTPYPLVTNFSSAVETINDIDAFAAAIKAYASVGACLLKGNLDQQLVEESRQGHALSLEATEWVVLDFDGAPFATVDEALEHLGLANISYIQQHSASSGLKPGLRAHVFMLLSSPLPPSSIKNWLLWMNYEKLSNHLTLNRTGDGLRYPLDVTVASAAKLIYIAPPVLTDREDPIKARITTHHKDEPRLNLHTALEALRTYSLASKKAYYTAELRLSAGLRKRTFKTRVYKGSTTPVIVNPEPADSYEFKLDTPFVHLNINGGDSWAYWHLQTQPELLFNFKDEGIAHRIQDILPEYYPIALENAQIAAKDNQLDNRERRAAAPIKYWVINDAATSHYYTVTYNEGTRELTLNPARTLKHLEDFCTLKNIEMPEAIETWNIIFDPSSTQVMDFNNHVINVYEPSDYILNATDRGRPKLPPMYYKLLYHVLGNDSEALDDFLNWLGFILQTGQKPKTSWLLHGTYGTGKGRLYDVLKALLGPKQSLKWTANRLADNFNAALRNCQLLFLDEVTLDNASFAALDDQLKSLISEDELAIRAMRVDTTTATNYTAVIAAANEENPVRVPHQDRRWNVPPRQSKRIELSPEEYEAFLHPENLQALADHLVRRTIDTYRVLYPRHTDAKAEIQATTTKVPRMVVEKLQAGDFDYLLRHVPLMRDNPGTNADLMFAYKKILAHIYDELSRFPTDTYVTVGLVAEELRTVFAVIADWTTHGGGKFETALARFGLPLANGRIRRQDLNPSLEYTGLSFQFHMTEATKTYYLQHVQKQPDSLELHKNTRPAE